MMDQDVAGGDGAEDPPLLVLDVEAGRDDRRPGAEAERRQRRAAGERHQVLEGERPLHLVELGFAELELVEEEVEHPARHPLGDLQPHHGGEAALAELLLDHFQQVLGGLLVAVDVGVAGHPEGVGLDDLHAGEQAVEVVGDHLFERHEAERLRHLHPARQHVRRLDPGEAGRRVSRRLDRDGERQADVRDEREGVGGVDRQRRQHGEELAVELVGEVAPLAPPQPVPAHQLEAVLGEGREEVAVEQPALALDHRPHLGVDRRELLEGGAVGAGIELAHVAGELLLQAAHPLHEELVEVGVEDGDELQPLQQRVGGVLRLVQHAGVELQPRQLAVEQIGGCDDLLDRFHAGWVGLGHGALDLRRIGEAILPPGNRNRNSVISRRGPDVTAV